MQHAALDAADGERLLLAAQIDVLFYFADGHYECRLMRQINMRWREVGNPTRIISDHGDAKKLYRVANCKSSLILDITQPITTIR